LGYNLWARSGEKFYFDRTNCCDKKYAVKGDAYLYGYFIFSGVNTNYVGISATQNKANIHKGLNHPERTNEHASCNPRIDNPQPAYSSAYPLRDMVEGELNCLQTSIPPVLISPADLAINRSPKALTHKIFAHINYIREKDNISKKYQAYLGVGGEAEFAQKNIHLAGVSQWGTWIKGGFTFN